MTLELPRGPRKGDLYEVHIERLSTKGLGIGTFNAVVGPQREHKMYRALVRKAVPGDVVMASVESMRRKELTCRIDSFITRSSMRVEPVCRHFGFRHETGKGCGGCVLQSLDYRHQLMIKERGVKLLMQNNGIDPGLVLPVIGLDEPWFYRNKMEFSIGTDGDSDTTVGMHKSGYKYDVLSLGECHLQSEFSSSFVPQMQQWFRDHKMRPFEPRFEQGWLRTMTIREGKRTGERMLILTTTSATHVSCDGAEGVEAQDAAFAWLKGVHHITQELGATPWTSIIWVQHVAKRGEPTRMHERVLFGKSVLYEELHLPHNQVLRFEIDPGAFFQPNTFQAEVLYAKVIEYTGLIESSASSVLDLYCGTGTIGLCMAPYCDKVTGIELNAQAVINAQKNATYNQMDHVSFFQGDVGKVLQSQEFVDTAGDVDLVVVDPPRAGLFAQARAQIKEFGAPRLVYVSCNPESLARDLMDLSQQGGYVVRTIQPIDMFPHTYHIEHVALLELV